MNEDLSLPDIDEQLGKLADTLAANSLEEVELQRQITKMRLRVAELQGNKAKIKSKHRSLLDARESIERREALRLEQEKIQEEFELLRQRAEKLVATAPWFPPDPDRVDRIFKWQFDGAVKLGAAQRALLADVRGMGKTLSSLAWRRVAESKRTLALTRKQYAPELVREFKHWEPDLGVVPLISPSPLQRKTLLSFVKSSDDIIVVSNFETWRRSNDSIKDFLDAGFDGIILDEAHQLKSFHSATTEGFKELAYSIPKILEMTGTPVQNRPQELFAILHTLYPDLFMEERFFVRDYCYQIAQNRWTWQPGGLQALMKKMDNFFIARAPEDVGHMVPPPMIHNIELDFSGHEEQAAAYKLLATQQFLQVKDRTLALMEVLAVYTRLAQMVAWPPGIKVPEVDEEGNRTGYTETVEVYQSVKIDWAEDLIKELTEEDHRVVLFSRFIEPLHELERRLNVAGIPVAKIMGGVDENYKREVIQDFDLKTAPVNPKYQALIATYDTIGESVNLNAARHLIQFDRFWKPSRDDQAVGRIDRINNEHQATVWRNTVADSIDVLMNQIIDDKRKMISEFSTAKDLQQGLMTHLESWM